MATLGNPAEARTAYNLAYGLTDQLTGWHRIGQGRSRVAYLSPTGVVYKVPYDAHPDADGRRDNRIEAAQFRAWAGRSFAPQATLYTIPDEYGDPVPVLAMEHVVADGSEPQNLADMLAALAQVGALDLNVGNWIVRSGRAIVIDAAGV